MLESLVVLTQLNINDYALADANFLLHLTILTSFTVSCSIEDFSMLKSCSKIRLLKLYDKSLKSVSFLRDLKELDHLMLMEVPEDFNYLPDHCKILEFFYCS